MRVTSLMALLARGKLPGHSVPRRVASTAIASPEIVRGRIAAKLDSLYLAVGLGRTWHGMTLRESG